jgi:biotin carboxylase
MVSTTDRQAVLQIARSEHIDGIVAYASDPAAPTAAYVARELGLPGQPLEAVSLLTEKDRFRVFLADHGFCSPKARGYTCSSELLRDWDDFCLPLLLKPVDSSGSKGVNLINCPEQVPLAFSQARSFSRTGRVIAEEYVTMKGYQVAGDGFSINGQLVFRCFGNDHFSPGVNPFVPVAASFPLDRTQTLQTSIHNEIQRLFDLLGLKTGAYNFDIRVDDADNIFLMEVGPRNGGNFIPQVIRYATGIDLIDWTIRAALGDSLSNAMAAETDGYWSYYAVHNDRAGRLISIDIDPSVLNNNLVESHLSYQPGDSVPAFTGANGSIGILIMRFSSMQEMLQMMDNANEWIRVQVQNE